MGGPTRTMQQEPGETDGLSAPTWTWALVCLGRALLLVGTACLRSHMREKSRRRLVEPAPPGTEAGAEDRRRTEVSLP